MPAYTSNKKGLDLDQKATPISADGFILSDSADSKRAKYTLLSSLATALVNIFNTTVGMLKVAVDGSTITGDGTIGNPLVSHAGGGAVSITNTDTFLTVTPSPLTNTGTINVDMATLEPAMATALEGDTSFITNMTTLIGGGSGGGSQSAANITEFDDFDDAIMTSDGSNNYQISGNFVVPKTGSSMIPTETDHPGIVRISASPSDPLVGFASTIDFQGGYTNPLIDTTSDFTIDSLHRWHYTGVTYTIDIELSNTIFIMSQASPFIQVGDGTAIHTTTTPIPLTDTWFYLKVNYVALTNTLTFYLNGVPIYSGLGAMLSNGNVYIQCGAGTAGDYLDTDFVQTTYKTNRTSPPFAGGGSSEKKVGVGEITDTKWFNIQYPFLTNDFWAYTGATGGSASFLELIGGYYATTNNYLPDFDYAGGVLSFDSGKQVIVQGLVFTNNTAGIGGGFGFNKSGNPAYIIHGQGSSNIAIGFIRADVGGQWYTKCADGTGHTENAQTISNGKHIFRIEYDPSNATPQARFYVDGILIDTITTNLPTAQGFAIQFTEGNYTGSGHAFAEIGAPSFAVEI